MKNFKTFDFLGQVLIMVIFLAGGFLVSELWFLVGYFVVGGWQVLSVVVHQVNRWHVQKGSRRLYYHFFVAIIILVMIVSFIFPSLLMVWYIMVVAGPIMALYYAFICYREVFHPVKRPLDFI